MKVKLGASYKDRVTGFTGVATGRAEYLYQNPEVRLEAETGQEDEKTRWIPEERLDIAPERAAGFSAP